MNNLVGCRHLSHLHSVSLHFEASSDGAGNEGEGEGEGLVDGGLCVGSAAKHVTYGSVRTRSYDGTSSIYIVQQSSRRFAAADGYINGR